MNQTCLICDCEFESMSEVLNHIEKLHLNIILKPTVNCNNEKIDNMEEEDFKIDIEENFIETSWESNFTKSQGQLGTIKAENTDYTSATDSIKIETSEEIISNRQIKDKNLPEFKQEITQDLDEIEVFAIRLSILVTSQ